MKPDLFIKQKGTLYMDSVLTRKIKAFFQQTICLFKSKRIIGKNVGWFQRLRPSLQNHLLWTISKEYVWLERIRISLEHELYQNED